MDISAFSEDDFDVKNWINKTLKCGEIQEDKDAFVSSLVMKLQLYVQQVNGSLEEISQSVLSSLPRVLRDTQLLEQEAVTLKDKMIAVKEEIVNVEKNTAESMKALENIDKIKSQLQTAKQSLHEADNWTVLANDVEEVFESGDIENISIKLASMQKSLTMLTNAADFEDKKLQLEGLKNRLEALASPKLVQAFTTKNLDQSKMYITIFERIDRLAQLVKYYHNCLKVSLCQEWHKITEVAQDESLSSWLHTFYDKLLSEWQEQIKWCHQVFPIAPCDLLIEIYTDILKNMNPNLTDCISSLFKQHPATLHLTILLELKQITKNFATNLHNTIENSTKKKVNSDKLLLLVQAIYSGYVPHIANYSKYEAIQLNNQLNSIEVNQEEGLSEMINSLSLSVPKVMDFILQSEKRCQQFTEGCSYPSLVRTLNALIDKEYLEKYRICIKRINKSKSKDEDWNLFQMCLTLIQVMGDLLMQIEDNERQLISNILDTNNKFKNPLNTFENYLNVLSTNIGRSELDNLMVLISTNSDKRIYEVVIKSINQLIKNLYNTTYDVLFMPIYTQLLDLKKAPGWTTGTNNSDKKMYNYSVDLPDYSFAPQEYITQVGQYLMTLPQHLEPFLLRDNPSLIYGLKVIDCQGSIDCNFTDYFLESIAKGTCQMFQDQTFGICQLNTVACKQLATDIDYLGNVLDELGLQLSDNLQQMSMLLRLNPKDWNTKSAGSNPRIVAAVRQMRNIQSSG